MERKEPEDIRKFGLLFGLIGAILAGISYYRNGSGWIWMAGAAAFFVLTGLFGQPLLRPLYSVWMKFAYALGWVNTRLLLGVFYFLIVTPIGVTMRLLRKDLLSTTLDRSAKSYWIRRKKTAFDQGRTEKQF